MMAGSHSEYRTASATTHARVEPLYLLNLYAEIEE
jgi:hypothetical protein